MGDYETWPLGCVESLVKYHSCYVRFLTGALKRVSGQCQVGGLTGAVASKRVTEAREGHLTLVGNQRNKCKGKRWLDCETNKSSRYESRS